mgnify:CR=1 FL=1
MNAGAMHRLKRWFLITTVAAVAASASLGVYVYSGHYNIAADEPHWFITAKIIETLRDRSIDHLSPCAHHAHGTQLIETARHVAQ